MTLKGLSLGQVEQRLGGMTERRAKRNGLATVRPRLVAQAPQAPQCLAGRSHPPHLPRALGHLQLPRPPHGRAAQHQPATGRGGGGAIEQPEPYPAAIHPRRLELDADGERGRHGETGRGSGPAPPPGASTAQPDPVPWPSLPRGSASAATASIALATSTAKAGPRRAPPGAA
jgi:hypothetical protein